MPRKGQFLVWDEEKQLQRCCTCVAWLPLSEFSRDLARPRGHTYTCRTCHNRTGRVNRNKPRERAYHYKRKYGITPGDYEEMLIQQNGGCAICHLPEHQTKRGCLDVDHDHKSGRIRGLLCPRCNKAIGAFKEDVDILHAAIGYLNSDNWEDVA